MYKFQRLKQSQTIRSLVRENQYSLDDLVYPLFITGGEQKKETITAMPGQFRFSIDAVLKEITSAMEQGIKAFLIFGVNNPKSENASYAYKTDGLIQTAIREIKKQIPGIYLIADVCICAYTSHGHCAIFSDDQIDYKSTLEVLSKTALSYAESGVDMVAPSAMIDGQVESIRSVLDKNNFSRTAIMGYSAKFFSSFYGPFREAADSAPQFGDRASYQMDPANIRQALAEIESDISEGADVVMIKPAMVYADVIWQARQLTRLPVAVYNVSGEYSMIKSAAEAGYINEKAVVIETLNSFKRAGADWIITYFARQAAEYLK